MEISSMHVSNEYINTLMCNSDELRGVNVQLRWNTFRRAVLFWYIKANPTVSLCHECFITTI